MTITVPTAAVAISGGSDSPPDQTPSRPDTTTPRPDTPRLDAHPQTRHQTPTQPGQTDACENITLPASLRYVVGNKTKIYQIGSALTGQKMFNMQEVTDAGIQLELGLFLMRAYIFVPLLFLTVSVPLCPLFPSEDVSIDDVVH